MREMLVDEVRRAVRGRWMAVGADVTVTGVSTDSRTARRGDLFVALKGERFDGHDFLSAAAAAGCLAALVRQDLALAPSLSRSFGGGVIGVGDTTEALGQLAGHHRRLCPATVVAVTGSNGKTTVKRMIHHILSRRRAGSCSPKSFNNAVGLPLTLLAVGGRDDYVVCELGTNAPGEIAALTRIARPDIAVVTSVAETHLEKLGTLQRVAVEKASVLSGLAPSGIGVIWADSELLDRAVRPYEVRLVRFGVNDKADLRLTGYEPAADGQRFQMNGRLWVRLPLPGRHNALNALAAIAVAQRMGLEQDEAASALADMPGGEMRLERLRTGGLTVINDAYNANPASVTAAADVLAETAGRRKVLIVGDMRELGEHSEELHLRTGRDVAGRKIDLLIGVGTLGRYIATGASEKGLRCECFTSLAEACRGVPALLRRGDAVLIKGSRAMTMEKLLAPIQQAFPPAGGRPGGRRRKDAAS